MKSISLTLLACFMIFAGGVSAQDVKVLTSSEVAKLDLNGKWTGKRHQYSWDKQSFIETFQYEFELKQEGNIITGTSTIISSNGEYADMKLEGFILGEKLYFREVEVKGAIRPDGKVWCFKSGELRFAKNGENISLIGATPSYMEIYNYPCSGGYTELVKVDNANNAAVVTFNTNPVNLNIEEKINISIFPNPFVDNATISYNLIEDSKVKVELMDISGKMVGQLFDGNQKTGSYNLALNSKNYADMSGMFIVKMTVNGEVFSRQLVQMK